MLSNFYIVILGVAKVIAIFVSYLYVIIMLEILYIINLYMIFYLYQYLIDNNEYGILMYINAA